MQMCGYARIHTHILFLDILVPYICNKICMNTVVCFGQDYTESGILERGTRSSLVEILSHPAHFDARRLQR